MEIQHSPKLSITEIMLMVQKAEDKDFPLKVKIGRGTANIVNKKQATFFSLGILMALDAKHEEDGFDDGKHDGFCGDDPNPGFRTH